MLVEGADHHIQCDRMAGRVILRVRLFNVGLHFLAEKFAFPCLSVDRFGKNFWGLITLGHVKSVPYFC